MELAYVKKQSDTVGILLQQRVIRRLENLVNSYKDMINRCNLFGEVVINCEEYGLLNI